MSYLLARRALLGCASSLLMVANAIAAPPSSAEFAVSAAQIKALGVKLMPLEKPSAISGTAYPARVVVPPGANHVISAPLGGMVEAILVNDQEPVKTGQALLRLSSTEYGDLQLKLLEADSKARLTSQTAARERQLFSEGIIPERRVQEANAAQQEASARLRFAGASLRLAGADPAAVLKAGGGGNLQSVFVVRARNSGTVVGLDVKAGQRVQGSDSLLRLVNLQQLLLEVQVPADRQQQVLSNKAIASIQVVGRDATATPVSVGATVNDNQTVTLRARVEKGGDLLRPDEVVQVQIPFAQNSAGWALPLAAVARQDDKAYVFVRTQKGFAAESVNVVSSAGQSVQVTGNLSAGQQVATSSVIALKAAWLGKSGGE